MTFRQIRIEREGLFHVHFGVLIQFCLLCHRREITCFDAEGSSQFSIGGGEIRVCGDGLLEQLDGGFIVIRVLATHIHLAAHVGIVCRGAVRLNTQRKRRLPGPQGREIYGSCHSQDDNCQDEFEP